MLNALLADLFALYLKTKNFHWHISGPHFRDYHLLLDEQAEQIFATTDAIAERVRKIGGTTLRSVGHIRRLQRLLDNVAQRYGMLPGRVAEGHAAALKELWKLAYREASTLAYADAFRAIMLAFVVATLLVPLLRNVTPRRAPPDAH